MWNQVPLDASLYRSPSQVTPARVIGKLEFLPLNELPWEDFERIQWRILRDVEGLRYAQIYGERGQAQEGLDVVALAPDGGGVGLQSKKYKRFGPADLKAAVKKFRDTERPFTIDRLIIGVSIDVKSKTVPPVLAALRKDLHPIELDLWDRQELSLLLRTSPNIVVEFFGEETARAFCLPFELESVVVPSVETVAIREALARTPEETTGAAELLREARALTNDPVRALALIEEAQGKLRATPFGAYAAQYDVERGRLLARVGRADEAARQCLDEFWAALDLGLTSTADVAHRRLRELVRAGAAPWFTQVAGAASNLYFNPLGAVADVAGIGEDVDRARLAALAGEVAVANDDLAALSSLSETLASAIESDFRDPVLRTRLRMLAAEATGDWTAILADARKLKLGYDLLALVTARYARHRALNQKFKDAEALWDDATGDASLARRWTDATTWTMSRRAFREYWNPFTSDEALPLQKALLELGPAPRILAIAESAYESALDALRADQLRSAAIFAQRALRDAVSAGDWEGEREARRVLAAALAKADEPGLAAGHLARAGAVKEIKELGRQFADRFIDVTPELSAPNYWTVGTAFRLIEQQADLVPDDVVEVISERILIEIAGAEANELPDIRMLAVSRYNGAIGALAGLAHRLTPDRAEKALAHFEQQPLLDGEHYRFHDQNEAVAVARIALARPEFAERACTHLVKLLARSQSARKQVAQQAVDRFLDVTRPLLAALAANGNHWARETLAFHDTESVPPEQAAAALARLTTPLVHKPGVFTEGTSAVGDSLLVLGLPGDRLDPAVSELLRRADDKHVGAADRGDYLIAAANLAPQLSAADRSEHFAAAIHGASAPRSSLHDEWEQRFSHRLGGMRVVRNDMDSRERALFLAACLAGTDGQRAVVRDQAYELLVDASESGYWVTRALQQLGDAMREDVGYLLTQGWALRSFAAILWARHGTPVQTGMRLATDSDVRVRRTLAEALSGTEPDEVRRPVRDRLAQDPSYSVRSVLA
ncbi:hypothetical protein [Pilimelia columellifera]|uniref:Restriction endonuclease n=1 Tax=Pilimelia columellifera subsp. columellifera TaxID=706583 RepID=A0ABN3NI55_9ACTN